MTPEQIFLAASFLLFIAMIGWTLIVSPALRDRRVRGLARAARLTATPVEVTINFIMLPSKAGFRQSDWNFDIQTADQHWYFSVCTFWTPSAVTKLSNGEKGLMYTKTGADLTACCIVVKGLQLLGTVSHELPKDQLDKCNSSQRD